MIMMGESIRQIWVKVFFLFLHCRSGSIIVDFGLTMDGGDITPNGVTEALQDGDFGNLSVDATSFSVDGMSFNFFKSKISSF